MIKLNRTTEYGLMALRHMSEKGKTDPGLTSAREVADLYGLPFEITAKTLQRMKEIGLIGSAQGARGGYTLQRKLEEISLEEFLQLMEGPQGVVACTNHVPEKPGSTGPSTSCHCDYQARCGIQGMMSELNVKVRKFLSGIRLSDLSEKDFLKAVPQAARLATQFEEEP